MKAAVWPPSVPGAKTDNARLTQAKLFVEIARRVDRPLDALPSGDAALVSAVLWQRAAAWAIAASEELVSGAPDSAGRRELLERVAGGSEALAAVETILHGDVGVPSAASSAAVEATTLASFAEKLVGELERPARDLRRRRSIRVTILLVAGVIALLGAMVNAWRSRPPDLVRSATRTQSSQLYTCMSGECGNALFCTNNELNPWVQYDFGSPKRLHSISVTNRTDCCFERAVPLVVETSNDGRRWKEQVRVDEPFMTWSSKLGGRARYVRLRAAKTTHLHLSTTVIR